MTLPVLLDLLLCHSRAWLPREESRSFPTVLQRNSGFLARARHARGNDRKIRPSGRAVSLSCAGLNKIEVHSLGALVTNLGSSPALHFRYLELAPRAGFEPAT